MNCFKGKMALKMGGWVGVYFPLHKGVIKQKMLLKLVHFWKAILQRLLADSAFYTFFFSREISLRFLLRGQATVDLLGYKKTTLGPGWSLSISLEAVF